ncbi:MAG: hypothetical protein IGS23_09570 [Rivularia sp. T60_A2020_040]|nr:hypothetical protein [Rivularia sp. T60_A2020_040]
MIQKKNYYLLLVFSFWILISNLFNYSALAASSIIIPLPIEDYEKKNRRDAENAEEGGKERWVILDGDRDNNTKEKSFCSNQDLSVLTTKLLRDLPAYFNRATQRARRLDRSVQVYSYMLVAGKPDFTPLPLKSWTDEADKSVNGTKGVEQVFFTTLERQYVKGKAVQLQQFHWLFLTKTESGWQMAMMYSQTGGYPKQKPPTPPRESSDSAVAQGIQTWLRDCRAVNRE